MIRQDEIWKVLSASLSEANWMNLADIYRIVEQCLDVVNVPNAQWKRNVRNVLQRRKQSGEIEWDGSGAYRLRSQ